MKANRLTRTGMLLAALFFCVGCDQVTKNIATRELASRRDPIRFLGDTFRLQYARNPGAFLGMGGNLDPGLRFWSLTIANGVVLLILGYVLVTRWEMALGHFAAWSLILAGGIGNLIDRVSQHGLVTDFLNIGIGQLRTGIFNVADMAVTAGFALYLLLWWRDEKTARAKRVVADQQPS